jgi:hypothetical protein
MGQLKLFCAQNGVGGGEIQHNDMRAGGGEDRAMMIAQQACATGDNGDAAG